MRKTAIALLLGAASIGLAACGDTGTANNAADDNVAASTEGGMDNGGTAATNGAAGNTASAAFPKGSTIVEDKGVTYRVDADGTRVALGPNDSRIVVDKGVRYRVDPDGTRVRIDPKGAAIDIDLPDLTPDVDVGTNEKGHLDVDVKGHKDGDNVPN